MPPRDQRVVVRFGEAADRAGPWAERTQSGTRYQAAGVASCCRGLPDLNAGLLG